MEGPARVDPIGRPRRCLHSPVRVVVIDPGEADCVAERPLLLYCIRAVPSEEARRPPGGGGGGREAVACLQALHVVSLGIAVLILGGVLRRQGGALDHSIAERGQVILATLNRDEELTARGQEPSVNVVNTLDGDGVGGAGCHAGRLRRRGAELFERIGDARVELGAGQGTDVHGGAAGLHRHSARLHDAAWYGVAGVLVVDYRRADLAMLCVRRDRAEGSRWRDMRRCGDAVIVTALGGYNGGGCGLEGKGDAVVADTECGCYSLIGIFVLH